MQLKQWDYIGDQTLQIGTTTRNKDRNSNLWDAIRKIYTYNEEIVRGRSYKNLLLVTAEGWRRNSDLIDDYHLLIMKFKSANNYDIW